MVPAGPGRTRTAPSATSTSDEDGDYVSWLGVPSLPKLNYDSAELRRRRLRRPGRRGPPVAGRPSGLDGWRVDVANMTGAARRRRPQPRGGPADARRHDGRAARRAARRRALPRRQRRPRPVTAGTASMNYAGFTRPVWTWLRDQGPRRPTSSASPVVVPRLGGRCRASRRMRDFARARAVADRPCTPQPASARTTPRRIRTLVGELRVEVAAGLLLTMPGDADGHLRRRDRHAGRRSARTVDGRCRGTSAAGTHDCSGVYRGLIAARQVEPPFGTEACAGSHAERGRRSSSSAQTPGGAPLVHVPALRHAPVDSHAPPDGSGERP